MNQSLVFWSAATLYAISTILFFLDAAFRSQRILSWGKWIGLGGLLPHAAAIVLRWVEVGHGPYSSRYEVISSNVFLLVVAWGVSTLVSRGLSSLGAFVMPAAFLGLGWAVSWFDVRADVPIIFKSWWLFLHIGFAKVFGATVLLAAACGVAFLIKDGHEQRLPRFPTAKKLDLQGHQYLLVSFLCLGVMIVAGSLWANQSWGRFWAWDPIETSSLVTWIVFGIILHFRVLHRWDGRRMAWLSLCALASALVTVYVVTLAVPTIHNSYMTK